MRLAGSGFASPGASRYSGFQTSTVLWLGHSYRDLEAILVLRELRKVVVAFPVIDHSSSDNWHGSVCLYLIFIYTIYTYVCVYYVINFPDFMKGSFMII